MGGLSAGAIDGVDRVIWRECLLGSVADVEPSDANVRLVRLADSAIAEQPRFCAGLAAYAADAVYEAGVRPVRRNIVAGFPASSIVLATSSGTA